MRKSAIHGGILVLKKPVKNLTLQYTGINDIEMVGTQVSVHMNILQNINLKQVFRVCIFNGRSQGCGTGEFL